MASTALCAVSLTGVLVSTLTVNQQLAGYQLLLLKGLCSLFCGSMYTLLGDGLAVA